MDIIRKEDLEAFRSGAKELVDKIDRRRLEILEPTRTELEAIHKEVIAWLKKKKLKVYGGKAQHYLLAAKKSKELIYNDVQLVTSDVEFYSTTPIQDMVELADHLHELGFPFVKLSEGQHAETMKIFAFLTYNVCDCSYMPTNLYHRIPFVDLDGLYVVDPSWYSIDYFRVLTDMITSGWRLEKTMERSALLFKHYPLRQISKPKLPVPNPKTLAIRKAVWEYLRNKLSIAFVGEVGCYYYEKHKLPTPEEVSSYHVVSAEFRNDCYELIINLQRNFRVEIEERYPFGNNTGHRLDISYEGERIVTLFHYNYKCIPTHTIEVDEDTFYKVGTFSYVMLYNYIFMHMHRVNKEKEGEMFWRWRIQCMFEARNKYLAQKKLTVMDPGIYQDFIIDCVGQAEDPARLHRLRMMRRKEQRRPYTFSYTPGTDKHPDYKFYRFSNTSGNPINNPKNLKIIMPGATVPEAGPKEIDRGNRAEAGDEPDEELIEELEQEKGKAGPKEEKATRGRSRTREGSVNVTEAKEKTKKTKRGASKKKKSE
jgi:hypothetical protein